MCHPSCTISCCLLSALQRLKLTPEEEAERLQRTAFVGNLPIAIKKRTLLKHFGRWARRARTHVRTSSDHSALALERACYQEAGRPEARHPAATASCMQVSKVNS